jgi:hypothetical protein
MMDEMVWDVKTITTSDFTVKVLISQKMWDKWLGYLKQATKPCSFKSFFKKEIESQVNKLP